ncbi:amino acid adenylation domain-containing protein [Actinophytocola sp.]|uniref:non-ribosomal peptide synthetase n=1 Tax=Actinophytocola sp. TaxID=1872138 RepID=UPI002ED33188
MTDQLPPGRKRQLLAEALRRRSATPKAYPLSFGQQRLWFLDKFAPGLPVYSIPMAFRLRGPLDAPTLRSCLDTIVARHASLRTTFPDQGGEPVQVVAPTGTAEFEVITVTDVAEFIDAQARRGFDLTTGPLFRAALGVVGPDDHVLVLNLHHIISDAWSLSVLLRELTTLYQAESLPDLALQYPDFTTWQRERQRTDAAREQLEYWRTHLAGAPELLTLPTDRPRPAVQTYRGALHSTRLDTEFTTSLERMARECGGTLFMVLLAAFGAQLSRLAGQDDVVVGTPVAGRTDTDVERMIGFFVNTLPLRLSVTGDPTFAALVRQAKDVTLGGLSNAEVPFERLVEALQPQRSLGHAPLSQAQLILQNVPRLDLDLPNIACEGILPDPGVSKVDITLAVEIMRDGLLMSVEYNTDLFDAATIARLTDNLVAFLSAAAADPHRPVSALTAVTGVERWQIVHGFNDSGTDLPDATTALDLIDFTSTEIALTGPDGTLTFAELGSAVERLAGRLRDCGVGPETPVGLYVDRSTAMVVALLAVWAAGGAYVPLDPSWPADRLAYMLADSGAPVLLTNRDDQLTNDFSGTIVRPTDDGEPADAARVTGEHLAYLIYTSGSTGRPKGVGVPHRAVVNMLSSFVDVLALEPEDRLAAVTTLSFDISVLELLVPLVAGARVIVVADASDGPALRRQLIDSGATVMQATPATWRLLETAGGVPASLQVRICGGEAFPPDLAATLLADGGVVWNAYGPTETTVWSAAGIVADEQVHIGPPIANTRLYVLDPRGEPVPIGVVGELHIGGLGVTRGYHGQPALTAARFVPDPFGEPGARLYATGDLARFRPDGLLEFLGRADHQVKVRGFRIELGEIEMALLSCEDVRAAVVTTFGVGQDVRLVAYVIGAADEHVLRRRLPEYMMPARIMSLDEFPLTPNGKVDRRALPAPEFTSTVTWVAPRNPVEEVLAGIWSEVLAKPRIGVHDDFFRIGGHSLLAAKVLARVRDAFAVDVPIHRMFAMPTVAGLADVLTDLHTEPDQVTTIAALRLEIASLSDDEVRKLLGE